MTRSALALIRSVNRDQGGSVAVEFALVAPVLMFVLAGVIDIGSATHAKLSLDARVTTAAEYAVFQTVPSEQDSANDLAGKLAGFLQGEASGTADVIINNAARAQWTGTALTTSSLPGDVTACYCPSLVQGDLAWGPAAECGTLCADGDTAGQFVQISATTQHVTFFPGYAFIDGDTVEARSVVRMP